MEYNSECRIGIHVLFNNFNILEKICDSKLSLGRSFNSSGKCAGNIREYAVWLADIPRH